jgi:dihydroorotate dehydrogenase
MPLNILERFAFGQSLHHPWVFRSLIRPQLYRRNGNDPEAVHEDVLGTVSQQDAIDILRRNQKLFQAPEELNIDLNGRRITPFGTAAGMDKNGDALEPLSYVFGFQETGTVVVNGRPGNDRPRVAVDELSEDAWNAQGFPSRGLQYSVARFLQFRQDRGTAPTVYVSICGLPVSEERVIETAMQEMETLLKSLNPYVNGFVWNPFSPNTAALTRLREPQIFREAAELMKSHAPDKLLLVKMGPYEDDPEQKRQALALSEGFMNGGGHGVVTVNTVMFPKEKIPVANWGYPSGGRSGRFLQPYRMRSVRDYRSAFPNAAIVATGGISDGDDAYKTFLAGATMVEGYTPYTFHGLGLLPKIERRVAQRLRQDGYETMEQLQWRARNGAKLAA